MFGIIRGGGRCPRFGCLGIRTFIDRNLVLFCSELVCIIFQGLLYRLFLELLMFVCVACLLMFVIGWKWVADWLWVTDWLWDCLERWVRL